MAIKDITPKMGFTEDEMELLGIEVTTEEVEEYDYTPRRSVKDLTKIVLNDLPVGQEVTGEPDVSIYYNDEKEINGKKFEAKNYDTVNMRLFGDDGTDYLEIYINTPKIDENGFITDINKNNGFMQNCFNLLFGYLRLVNEDLLIDSESPDGYINHFKKINLKFIVEKLNELTDIKIKVTAGQKGYQGFLITEIWD